MDPPTNPASHLLDRLALARRRMERASTNTRTLITIAATIFVTSGLLRLATDHRIVEIALAEPPPPTAH